LDAVVIASSASEGLGYESATKTFEHVEQIHLAGKTSHPPVHLDTQAIYQDRMSNSKVGSLPPFAFYNPSSGWANSTATMQALAKRCVDAGVRFEVGQVNQLIIGDGDVKGVQMDVGRQFWASKLVVLAAGSWTTAILPELQDKIKATGQVVAKVQLTPEEVTNYRNAVS
jgi:sarcosine oxidase/L-pipecolate oxidase